MSLSYKENIPHIMGIVEQLNPKSILDVGPGFGKYGLLLKEQGLSKMAEQGNLEPDWDAVKIDCMELTEYFLDMPYLWFMYDNVYGEDFFKEESLKHVDHELILLIDVVEHHEKERVLAQLKRLKPGTKVLISTPKNTHMYTEKFYGDPHVHISQWVLEDFKDFKVEDRSSDLSHILIVYA